MMAKYVVVIIAAAFAAGTALAQTPAAKIPRTPDGKPDFSGVWQTGGISLSGTDANIVPPGGAPAAATGARGGGRGAAPGGGPGAGARGAGGPGGPGGGARGAGGGAAAGALPTTPTLLPEAAEIVAKYTAKDDPTVHCLLPGVPRIVSMPMPFEIIQTPKEVVILYEAFRAFRKIPIDGRTFDGEVLPSYMGDSHGRWEGDTLVVDVKNFNGKIWGPGAMRISSDQLHVVERYTHNGDTVAYEATISDPKVLAGPWVYRTTFRRPPDTRVMEYECLENNIDIPHLVR